MIPSTATKITLKITDDSINSANIKTVSFSSICIYVYGAKLVFYQHGDEAESRQISPINMP